uniref:Tim10-like domain-containing protein n=1 Tax=Timema douglasi TaxID=61478 RepID=A0A7R8VDA8_TIMDO|nr:unnamed protein product [Timema douglasi]
MEGSVPVFEWKGGLGGGVENHFGKSTFSTYDQDSNLDLPVIGSLVSCKSSAFAKHFIDVSVIERTPPMSSTDMAGQLSAMEAMTSSVIEGLNQTRAVIHRSEHSEESSTIISGFSAPAAVNMTPETSALDHQAPCKMSGPISSQSGSEVRLQQSHLEQPSCRVHGVGRFSEIQEGTLEQKFTRADLAGSTLTTCPNHRSLDVLTWTSRAVSIPTPLLTSSFLIVTNFVLWIVALRNSISDACSLDKSLLVKKSAVSCQSAPKKPWSNCTMAMEEYSLIMSTFSADDIPLGGSSSKEGEELQEFLMLEKQKAQFNAQASAKGIIHEFNDFCWEKCMEKPGSKLDSRTETCMNNCVDRFIDVSLLITNRFAQLLQKSAISPMASLVLTDSSQLTYDSQHLVSLVANKLYLMLGHLRALSVQVATLHSIRVIQSHYLLYIHMKYALLAAGSEDDTPQCYGLNDPYLQDNTPQCYGLKDPLPAGQYPEYVRHLVRLYTDSATLHVLQLFVSRLDALGWDL